MIYKKTFLSTIMFKDLLVQRVIMQANRWDPEKQKIRRPKNPQIKLWKYKSETGIPYERRV